MRHLALFYDEIASSEAPEAISKKVVFATPEQLLGWYRTEDGEGVIEMCMRAKSFRRAWTEYATGYNAKNHVRLGYFLCTTMDGVIQKFWVKKFNEINFRLLLSGKATDVRALEERPALATPQRLQLWYQGDGKGIIEACKAWEDFAETWKELTLEYNIHHGLELGWYIPTTINGVIFVFWWGEASPLNMVALLSGKTSIEAQRPTEKKGFYGTPEELRDWYAKGGKEILDTCRKAPGFKKTWREFADAFNKKERFTWGFRIPNNQVGLVNALGGKSGFTISEIVRLFEDLPEWTIIEDIKERTNKAVTIVLSPEIIEQKRIAAEAAAIARKADRMRRENEKRKMQERQRIAKQKAASDRKSEKEKAKKALQNVWVDASEKSILVAEKTQDATMGILRDMATEQTPQKSEEKLSVWQELIKRKPELVLAPIESQPFMPEFQERFPYFLNIHRDFYLPLRKFIELLEKEYPDEWKLNHEHMDIKILGKNMLIQIKESYVRSHSISAISSSFSDAYVWYNELIEKTSREGIHMDLHMEFPKEDLD